MNEVTASFNIYIVVRQYDPEVGVTMRNVFDIFSERLKTFHGFMRDWSHISVGFVQCWFLMALGIILVISVNGTAHADDLRQQAFYMSTAVIAIALTAQPPIRSFFKPLADLLRR